MTFIVFYKSIHYLLPLLSQFNLEYPAFLLIILKEVLGHLGPFIRHETLPLIDYSLIECYGCVMMSLFK